MSDGSPAPFSAGVRRRCPRCGEGRLFRGFLALEAECESCGLDFAAEDVGDGPVAFIILIVGFAILIPALVVEVAHGWPVWLHLLVWLPMALAMCLVLMPPLKGLWFALQYRHRPQETQPPDPE